MAPELPPAGLARCYWHCRLLADPGNEEHAALIADALFESLPLYLELNRPADLLADADRLTAEFPRFGKTTEIERLKTKAEEALAEKNEAPANEYE